MIATLGAIVEIIVFVAVVVFDSKEEELWKKGKELAELLAIYTFCKARNYLSHILQLAVINVLQKRRFKVYQSHSLLSPRFQRRR